MKTLCILFGGVSSEHEVSLRSASMVLGVVDRSRYSVVALGITRQGRWLYYDGPIALIATGEWENSRHVTPAILSPDRSHGGVLLLKESGPQPVPIRVDVAFGVLHGKNGEDGTVQGLFELAGIPYVGAKVLGSSLCMDKAVAYAVLRQAGLPKGRLEAVRRHELADIAAIEHRLAASPGYPMYIKPANAGSSVGVSRVEGPGALRAALELAFAHDRKIVAEEEIAGQEIECAVIGGIYAKGGPVAAGVLGEIVPAPKGFYDYKAKYEDDSAQLLIPARLSDNVARRVRELAVLAYGALECEGLARVDFFVREGGDVVVNEINTIPGFTAISMFPKLFEADGVSNAALIDRLIAYAMQD